MTMLIAAALVAVGLVLAGALTGGLYAIAPIGQHEALRVNRLTGAMLRCQLDLRFGDGYTCHRVDESDSYGLK